jgi:hypothetical protein
MSGEKSVCFFGRSYLEFEAKQRILSENVLRHIIYSDSNRDNLKLLKPSKEFIKKLIKYEEVIQLIVVEDVCKEQI